MTTFEFLSVAVSIVLALALGKLIAATPHVFESSRRDVIHAGFFLVNCFVVLNIWWFTWALNDKASWNFLEFLVMMGSPVSFYLAAHVLVADVPGAVTNWREHFAKVYRWYFAAILSTAIFAILRTLWVLGEDPLFSLGLVSLGIVLAIGIVSPRRSVHGGVLIVWLVFQVFALAQRFNTDL